MNFELQNYKGYPIRLINRNYTNRKAMRFTLYDTNQNVWIPKVYLENDGTLKKKINLDFIFMKAKRQIEIAQKEYIERMKKEKS